MPAGNLPLPGAAPAAVKRPGNTGTFQAPAPRTEALTLGPLSSTGTFSVVQTPTGQPMGLPSSPVLVSLTGTSSQPVFSGRPASQAHVPAVRLPAGPRSGADDLFAPPGGAGAELGLELDMREREPAPKPRPSASVVGDEISAPGMARPTAGNRDEVSLSNDDSVNPNSVRCPRHGLYFDKSKSSGCRKCLSQARKIAARIEESTSQVQLDGLRENPQRHALVGLGFALALGVLPAAFHAFRMGPVEVNRLRGEQEELSRKPGTEEVYRRFDEIDVQVEESRSRAMRNTGLVWLLVSAGALAGWFKIT